MATSSQLRNPDVAPCVSALRGTRAEAGMERASRSEAPETLDLKTALEIAGWPASLLAAEKQPTIIEDVKVQGHTSRITRACACE